MRIIMGRHLKRDKRGVSNIIVVVLSFVIIVMIVANVILWSYQMNQLDWEKMQENLNISNVSRATASSWYTAQNEFNITQGSITGGSYQDTKVLDGIHETFLEEASETTKFYYPSTYNTLGSTTRISGTLTNLQTNNGVYMTFRSYVSATSTTSKTDAFIAYKGSVPYTYPYPKNRIWNGESGVWGAEEIMSNPGSPPYWFRTAVCPKSERALEKIVVLNTAGYSMYAYVSDGASWTVTYITGTYPVSSYRLFDVAYEKDSGRALLVYGKTTSKIGYRIWTFGSGWSSEYLLDLPYTSGSVYWVCLASAPGTRAGTEDDNEIAMIYLDANQDVHGYIWTGSSWSLMGETAVWDSLAASPTTECLAVAYEQTSGRAMFIWGDAVATDFYYRIWDGSTLSSSTLLDIAAAGGDGDWVTLKSNPINNELLLTVVDEGSDLNTAYWSGSAWTVHTEHDFWVDTSSQRCADFAWEPTGSNGLLVWGTNANQISYKTFTAPNTWSAQANVGMGGSTHYWVQLRTNPRSVSGDVKILGAVLDSNNDIGAISWNGTTFSVIGASTITNDTTATNMECFELEFMEFGSPTEFTSEVEFIGTSNTESWTQLTWTIDGSFTTTGVTATLQLYNYQTEEYPTSGDGYMTSTIGTSDVTMSQNITTNPMYFRDPAGNWKIKIKGVKSVSTQFDLNVDFVELITEPVRTYRLCINNVFTISLSEYPLSHICGFEISVRYNVTEDIEKWFLEAYNWTSASFSYVGFNDTDGHQPILNNWNQFTISVTDNWMDYMEDDGTLIIEFYDEGLSGTDQTTVEIDFFGVTPIIDSIRLDLRNIGSSTAHVVSLWIINSTSHQRYGVNFFINLGEEKTYINVDISLPNGDFMVKVITDRGNTAIYSED